MPELTATDFPAGIELCRTGYSRNLSGDARRVTFDSATRHRRNSRRRGCTDTVCFVCTKGQCEQLELFHRQAGGSLFTISLPDWQGVSPTVARFDTPLTINPAGDYYEITASLYLPDPPVIPADQLDDYLLPMIGIIDGPFNDPLHVFVHQQWPPLWGPD